MAEISQSLGNELYPIFLPKSATLVLFILILDISAIIFQTTCRILFVYTIGRVWFYFGTETDKVILHLLIYFVFVSDVNIFISDMKVIKSARKINPPIHCSSVILIWRFAGLSACKQTLLLNKGSNLGR